MRYKDGDEIVLVKPFWFSEDSEVGNEEWDKVLRRSAPDPTYITGTVIEAEVLDDAGKAVGVNWEAKDGAVHFLYVDTDRIELAREPSSDEINAAIASITGGTKVSYDIALLGANGESLPTEHFTEGGTYKINGDNACDLNVTYNYAQVLRMCEGFSLKDLSGKTGAESLATLQHVRVLLGGDSDHPPKPWEDYWAPTPGNALAAINRLLVFAEEHPEGTWRVT